MADEKIIFSMTGVSKIYPPNKQVLKNIYLSFFYGAKIGVLGLNGSGKSSLLRIIAGIDKEFQGEVVSDLGYSVGYLEQEPQLDKTKTVREIVEEGVKIVFTSAGNPATWTQPLKKHGITVVHVISNLKFAQKAQDSGVDAIVGEGFEAGGHNGREETTTMCLIPLLKSKITIPIIAAGGIASGAAMLAAMNLGAEGVQIGSRFVASIESSAHKNFKQAVINAKDGDTQLSLKKLQPVRLLKNKFFLDVKAAEDRCASEDELKQLLGRARAKHGMFEGDLEEGELEIGQVAASIIEIQSVQEIVTEIITEYNTLVKSGFDTY